MRNWLQRLRPNPWVVRKLGMLVVLAGVGGAAFCWGRHGVAARVEAEPLLPFGVNTRPVSAPTNADSDYNRRVVAYLYGNVAVTREELGEYLIARFGAERLDFFVNRKLVMMEAAGQNITISDGEIEAQLQEELRLTNCSKEDFANLLKQRGKSMYEWREDVIRPRLVLAKLVRPTVNPTPKDIQDAFDARYGPKVQCRIIVIPPDATGSNDRIAIKMWDDVRGGRDAFLRCAGNQAVKELAAKQGEIPPIHRHFGEQKLEDAAFRLKEGEVSSLIGMKDGSNVILLCEKHVAADPHKRLEDERMKLDREVKEMQVAQAVPVRMQEMRQRANPRLLLTRDTAQVASNMAVPPPPAPTANVPPPPPATAGTPGVGRVPSGN